MSTPSTSSTATRIIVLTPDVEFASAVRGTFGASKAIDLTLVAGGVADQGGKLNAGDAAVVVVDCDAGQAEVLDALGRLTTRLGAAVPVIAITRSFDASVARTLMQMRVADFLVKPVPLIDLVRACARAAKSAGAPTTEAQITTFLSAVGGAGATTLAVQTAMLLMNSGGARGKSSTCLVDLDFQHGAISDYLDLEPRLNLAEIEPSPDRLDRQLLEVMLSHHASGLAVVAAPNRPAEMRSFDPDVVTRLLDLVSSHFDYVVFDMPRTWFAWTDSVLLGSNKLYIVSETTVPGLRHAKQLVGAITERLDGGPQPQVVVNRFAQKMFASGLGLNDIRQTLGEAFVSAIPNDYALVREAIDRGVPIDEVKAGNKITAQLKKLVIDSSRAGDGKSMPLLKKLKLSLAS